MKRHRYVYILILSWLIAGVQFGFAQTTDNSIGLVNDIIDGNYVGGIHNDKSSFKQSFPKKDFVVGNKRDLLNALSKSVAGQVIYIHDDATIDLSGESKLKIPEGVTLASGRGINGSAGALLYTNQNGTFPLIIVSGKNTKITGIRLKGPDTAIYSGGKSAFEGKTAEYINKNRAALHKQNTYGVKVSYGVGVTGPNFVLSNCEIFGWTYAGVALEGNAKNATIHHNYIHHNQRAGLGYGVVTKKGASVLIKANLFNYNRHSVAGTGEKDITVEVCYNKFLEDNNFSWAIDMHGGKDRNDGTDIAGKKITVHHNTIRLKDKALGVVIRGIPTEGAEIFNNHLIYVDRPKGKVRTAAKSVSGIEQKFAKGNMSVHNNKVD